MNFPYEKDLAKKLSSSKAITTTNMDERKFTKYRIEYYSGKPDILVLGSSRTMQVSSTSGNVLNLSVSGASVEDQIAFTVLALKKIKPKTIYLSADPWLFNENSGQNRWESIKEDYNDALRIISPYSTQPSLQQKSKFTFQEKSSTTDYGFRLYKKINIKYSKIGSTNETPGLYDKIRFDGSRIYNTNYANLKPNEIQNGFNKVITYSMLNWKYSHTAYTNYKKLIIFKKRKSMFFLSSRLIIHYCINRLQIMNICFFLQKKYFFL